MTLSPWIISRCIGVALAAFLWIHYLGMPYGLIAAVATALLFLPA
jgi:hypothetical protein